MTDTQKIQTMAKKDLAVIRNVESVKHLPTIYLFAAKTQKRKKMDNLTELCKSILLEQSQFAKLYVQNERKFSTPKRARKLERGYFGIVKGDSITFRDSSGTVTTKQLREV